MLCILSQVVSELFPLPCIYAFNGVYLLLVYQTALKIEVWARSDSSVLTEWKPTVCNVAYYTTRLFLFPLGSDICHCNSYCEPLSYDVCETERRKIKTPYIILMLISQSAKTSKKAENVTLKMTRLKSRLVNEVNGGLILRVWILDLVISMRMPTMSMVITRVRKNEYWELNEYQVAERICFIYGRLRLVQKEKEMYPWNWMIHSLSLECVDNRWIILDVFQK
jgi:hypothetical protein